MILNSSNWLHITSFDTYFSINHQSIPYIDGRGSDGSGDAKNPYFLLRKYTDANYWYIEFLNPDAFYHFPLRTIIPENILHLARGNQLVLVLCNNSEAYNNVVDGIYKFVVIGQDIPAEQILLLSSSPDIGREIEHISKKYNQKAIRSEFVPIFEFVAKRDYLKPADINKYARSTLINKTYNKKYLSFNGNSRTHRILLIQLLNLYDELGNGLVSYNSHSNVNYPSAKVSFEVMRKYFSNDPEVWLLAESNKDKICNLNHITLDVITNDMSVAHYNVTNKQYYEDTYYSVVTETIATSDCPGCGETGQGRLLSEKTFKPVLNCHPFILVGVPGALGFFRDLGYKTFSPIIDESYDNEYDTAKRIKMIAKEIKRLNHLNPEELSEFLNFCKPIVEHNLTNLLTKQYRTTPLT